MLYIISVRCFLAYFFFVIRSGRGDCLTESELTVINMIKVGKWKKKEKKKKKVRRGQKEQNDTRDERGETQRGMGRFQIYTITITVE